MGDAADDAFDEALKYEFGHDDDDFDDFGTPGVFNGTRHNWFILGGLTRNRRTAIRIKSGGATRAAHEVGGVLRHLLSLPR